MSVDEKTNEEQQGLECRDCGCRHLPVDRTVRSGNTVRRYRHCRNCGKHIVSVERIAG